MEEELRRQRNDLQSQLLEVSETRVAEVLLWDSKHMHAQYLARLKEITAELVSGAPFGPLLLRLYSLQEKTGHPNPTRVLLRLSFDHRCCKLNSKYVYYCAYFFEVSNTY